MNRGEVEELVQTTVRKMNTGPDACLTNPRVLSFFNIMKDSFHRCIKALSPSAASPEDTLASYNSVAHWLPDRLAEEVELILKRFPSVKESYTYAAVYIVEQTYKKETQQLKLKLPSFQQFVMTFYTQMIQSEPVQQKKYDTLQFFEKEMLCCQVFCNSLYTSIKTEPVVKPQSVIVESGDGGGGGSSKIRKENEKAALSKITVAQSRVGTGGQSSGLNEAAESRVASASRFSGRALSPQDSVSQLPRSQPRSSLGSVPPGTTIVEGGSTDPVAAPGSLTEDVLNRHRQNMRDVHPAKAAAARVSQVSQKAQAQKAEVERKADPVPPSSEETTQKIFKIVNVLENPQRQVAKAKSDDVSTSTTSTDSGSSSSSRGHKERRPRGHREREERPREREERPRDTRSSVSGRYEDEESFQFMDYGASQVSYRQSDGRRDRYGSDFPIRESSPDRRHRDYSDREPVKRYDGPSTSRLSGLQREPEREQKRASRQNPNRRH